MGVFKNKMDGENNGKPIKMYDLGLKNPIFANTYIYIEIGRPRHSSSSSFEAVRNPA